VLLVHGFATSFERTWRDNGWADLLAEAGRAVIGVDLLGHGDAPKPHDPADYADLEDRVLAALPPEPVDAIGFSMGGRVVLYLAATHPERFRKVVVAGVGANLFATAADRGEAIAEAVAGRPDPENPEAQYFAHLAAMPGNDPVALAACMRRQGPAITAELLGRITAPVLVVLGDRDSAGPADPLVAALGDVRLEVLRGVDHFATPKAFGFIDAALGFVDAVPA
jgi:pimeloyl-ACP methyl ester carboxylesterase